MIIQTNTPLINASRNGSDEIVELLIPKCVNINEKGQFGMTPLMFAAKCDDEDVVKLLLYAGADTTMVDNESKTAMQHAVDNKRKRAVECLRQHTKSRAVIIQFKKNNDNSNDESV